MTGEEQPQSKHNLVLKISNENKENKESNYIISSTMIKICPSCLNRT